MSHIKENEIYPKFDFRLTQKEKDWLQRELELLKEKFHEENYPAVSRNDILIAALRHGFRHLHAQTRLKEKGRLPQRENAPFSSTGKAQRRP